MSGRRRRISLGTIAMVLVTCVTVSATLGLMLTIRRDEGDLSMDAEKLLDSVTALMEMSQRHIGDEGTQHKIEISTTAVPSETSAQQAAPTHIAQTALATSAPQQIDVKHTVTMTFGGTVALESSVLSGAYNKEDKNYRYNELLSGISSAVHADLNFAILKSLLTNGTIHDKDVFAPASSVEALSSAGFDTVVLSHENTLAGGESTASEMLNALLASGMITTGLHLPDQARRYDMLQVNGIRVALLAYTETLSSSSKKVVHEPSVQDAMVHLLDLSRVQADIISAKAEGAQLVLLFVNWGEKDSTEPSAAQRSTAQFLCDAGADMLIGYNSKHVQPVEMLISGINPAHKMLTAWSMGTLISEDRATRGVVSGALLHVQVTCDEQTSAVQFDKIEYTPTYCWRQEEHGIYPYRVVRSDASVPEGMIQKQREILARALVLIQSTMNKGIAVQR